MSEPPVMRGAKLPDPERVDLVLPMHEPPLRVVLVEPRIPPNVGATSRICAAVGAPLYLVGEMTYREDHPARRRAGLDYWHIVEKIHRPDFEALRADHPQGRFHLFSTSAERSLYDLEFAPGDFLVFGSEDDGLPDTITDANPGECARIPMVRGVRSLNVASAAAIAAYEAARQLARSA